MVERFHFLVVYVGSAAMVAFVAACLSSPRVAMFACGADGVSGMEQCQLEATVDAAGPVERDPDVAPAGARRHASLAATDLR